MALLKAAESTAKGSSFSLDRKVSVRIYNAPASEENRIFYAMNQEGKKADPTRSKWLHRLGATKIAGALAEQCPSLRDNVDTIRDRLSKKNPRLCAFNTLSGAFEAYWGDCNPEEEEVFKAAVEFVAQFWNKLATVRPELAKLDITRRKRVRETLLVDSALAISAYVAIARKMQRPANRFVPPGSARPTRHRHHQNRHRRRTAGSGPLFSRKPDLGADRRPGAIDTKERPERSSRCAMPGKRETRC